MTSGNLATVLARWATSHVPGPSEVALADRALTDTLAVTLAARDHPILSVASSLTEAGRWAAAGHVLDFDDLHMPSTTHVSVVCVPATLAGGGDARAYLAGAGVMCRLGTALGWSHYQAGWHATCTAGAPAAAVAAAVSMNLHSEQTARAIALAIPAAGGVQRAFGTDAKSLQVAFAVEAGIRAARLAAAGATADLAVVEAWLGLVTSAPHADGPDFVDGPAVEDGLAIKLYPCCYALQRPINAVAEAVAQHAVRADQVEQVTVRTSAASVTPLVHHRPTTGLEGKFSLEYAVAAAILDEHQGFASFTDDAVQRPEAQQLLRRVDVELTPDGEGLLSGQFHATLDLVDGRAVTCHQTLPPGSPRRPPSSEQLAGKLADCLDGVDTDPNAWTWADAPHLLRKHLAR